MKRKVFYGSIIGFVLFLIAFLLTTYFEYGRELYIIGAVACGIICLVTGVCKENLVLTTVVSLGAYFVFLFGFLTEVFLFRLIGGGMAIALLVGKAILFKRKSNTKKTYL